MTKAIACKTWEAHLVADIFIKAVLEVAVCIFKASVEYAA